jgi:hypothetical protein
MGSYGLSALDALLRHACHKAHELPRRTCPDVLDGGVVNLIFVNRFFHPNHSATSQMLSDLAFGRLGHCQCWSRQSPYADGCSVRSKIFIWLS